MEMFHLRYFVAVAERLSFSGAARQLHMATSPLSQRVRDLERELGTALLERDSHNVRLTGSGAALLPLARDVLRRFDDIPVQLRQERGGRTVYFGLPPGVHPRLRARLSDLDERCGGYEIKRWPGASSELVAAVRRGELALAFAHLPVHAEGVSVRSLLREPLGAVLPAEEFAGRSSVSLSELVDHTYVRPAAGETPTYFDQLEVRFAAAGITRRLAVNTGDYGSTSEIVANGNAFGLSMLDPESAMQKHLSADTVILPFADVDPAMETGLVWRPDRAEKGADLEELLDSAHRVLPGSDE